MRSLGDKISSTIIAQSANVPTIAWSGSKLRLQSETNTCQLKTTGSLSSTLNSICLKSHGGNLDSDSLQSERAQNHSLSSNASSPPSPCELNYLNVPDDLYQQACIQSASDGILKAKEIGYPLMIKASEGGGGKGIRLIRKFQDFELGFHGVQKEVPGSPIFLMRLVENARHLEVQILADWTGEAIALFGRDCSLQRR